MNKETKLKIIPVIISIFALGISGWSAVQTNYIQQSTIDINQNSFNMQQDIYEANLPFQKPIIDVEITNFNTNITYGIMTDIGLLNEDICTTWNFDISLIFRNYGKGIAKDISYSIVMSDIYGLNWTENIGSYTTVNEIYPDTTSEIQVNVTYRNCELGIGAIYVNSIDNKIAFIVRSNYYDKVTGSLENQTYWFKYIISEDRIYDLTVEERDTLIQNYEIISGKIFEEIFFN